MSFSDGGYRGGAHRPDTRGKGVASPDPFQNRQPSDGHVDRHSRRRLGEQHRHRQLPGGAAHLHQARGDRSPLEHRPRYRPRSREVRATGAGRGRDGSRRPAPRLLQILLLLLLHDEGHHRGHEQADGSRSSRGVERRHKEEGEDGQESGETEAAAATAAATVAPVEGGERSEAARQEESRRRQWTRYSRAARPSDKEDLIFIDQTLFA